MAKVYGLIPPPGIRKAWEPCSMQVSGPAGAGRFMQGYGAPEDWGDPVRAVHWEDEHCASRMVCADYPNGRRVIVKWLVGMSRTTFTSVPA